VVDSPLVGRHQFRNIALAIATVEELSRFGFTVTPSQIEQGIRETHWPGRFQIVPPSPATQEKALVLDVAHNPAGAWALRSALSENFPDHPFTLVFGAMQDKAIREMADILFPIAEHVVVTHIDNPRASSTEQLLQAGSRTGAAMISEETVATALARAFDLTPQDVLVVVTGSIFLVGEAMKALEIPA
jgi:dihydrofolate synthase/folylpolyglutamate synthase